MSSLNNGKNGMAYEKEIEDLKDKKSQAAYCIRSIKNAWEKKGVDWDDRNKLPFSTQIGYFAGVQDKMNKYLKDLIAKQEAEKEINGQKLSLIDYIQKKEDV